MLRPELEEAPVEQPFEELLEHALIDHGVSSESSVAFVKNPLCKFREDADQPGKLHCVVQQEDRVAACERAEDIQHRRLDDETYSAAGQFPDFLHFDTGLLEERIHVPCSLVPQSEMGEVDGVDADLQVVVLDVVPLADPLQDRPGNLSSFEEEQIEVTCLDFHAFSDLVARNVRVALSLVEATLSYFLKPGNFPELSKLFGDPVMIGRLPPRNCGNVERSLVSATLD